MVNVHDVGLETFLREIKGKRLFFYGAGVRAAKIFSTCSLKDSLVAVVDRNRELWGTCFFSDERERIEIISPEQFAKQISQLGVHHAALLITPVFHATNILDQLNRMEELDGLVCYLEDFLLRFYERQPFDFKVGKQLIPKKIHYCWFGGSVIPRHLKNCIETWEEKCPDYEIIRWDENNYDVTKNRYMREAYESKKWGFVSDYARLDIVYHEGGIYLDTDVELLRSMDEVLTDEAFFGFESELSINLGIGFGAIERHWLIKELRDAYASKSFYNADGSMNLTPCPSYQHPIFCAHNFGLKNMYQNRNRVALYPTEVFSPMGMDQVVNCLTDKTISIHHYEGSWLPEEDRKGLEDYRLYQITRS